MYGRDNLFDTIMSLRHTEIPYRSARNKGYQPKPKKQRKPKPITISDSRYSHLVAEGSRLDITIERRMEIREELTLIRQQKRMMMKIEYHM
ncbi:hypothetical protein C0Q44_15625 [Paenibacillus sp. PCH8]|nr:hypothetical protein C0Q44_15625 [Paenibacillus sp. PCH8]